MKTRFKTAPAPAGKQAQAGGAVPRG